MSEQPTAKHLKLHHKAMQVIPEWMGKWGIKAPKAELWNDPYFPPAKDLLSALDRRFKAAFQEDEAVRADLDRRLKTAFQEDEAVRADLLAACVAALIEIDAAVASGEVVSSSLRRRLEVAIVNAKETDR